MRFRRKSAAETTGAGTGDVPATAPADEAAAGTADAPPAPVTRTGPLDAAEDHGIDLDRTIDLGALLIAAIDHLDVRLQVDEATSTVASVLLANDDGAVELRPFAAPRSGGLWDEIRPGVAEEVTRLGGRSEEVEGAHGTELRVMIPLQSPEGEQVVQPSRVFGIEGPRWMVRATMLGRPAVKVDEDGPWWDALSRVVVVRGDSAMAPGDPLQLRMPPGAYGDDQADQADQAGDSGREV